MQIFPRNTLRGTRGALIASALRHRGVRCYICEHSVYKCERRVHICKRPMPLTAGAARPLAAHHSSRLPRKGGLLLGRSEAKAADSGRAAPAWPLSERSAGRRTAGAQRPRCLNGLLRYRIAPAYVQTQTTYNPIPMQFRCRSVGSSV